MRVTQPDTKVRLEGLYKKKNLEYSELRSAQRVDLVHAVPLAGPLSIYIETTNICNFKCTFCPESFPNYKEKTGGWFKLGENDFRRIADQIKEIGTVRTINFYMMGEPFANKNVISFVKYAKDNQVGCKLIVTSNGSLLHESIYKDICESGLDYLRISIYGSDELSHLKNSRSNIKLSRIIDNVSGFRTFRDKGNYRTPFIYIKMIESMIESENQAFLDTFKYIGDEVKIEPVMNWNDPEEGVLANVSRDELIEKDYFKSKKSVCPFPFYTLVIHSDLKVSVCCVDWDKKTVIGDLSSNTLSEIWRGEQLKEFQLTHLRRRREELDGCNTCTYLHTAPDNLEGLTESQFLSRLEGASTAKEL